MANHHQLDQTVKIFIINAIDPTGYDADPKTAKEKVQFLKETFESEKQWHIDQVGRPKALQEWLMGLPSCIDLPFYNHDILEHAVKWGSLKEDATEREQDKLLENYWRFMASKVDHLFTGWHFPKNLDKEV